MTAKELAYKLWCGPSDLELGFELWERAGGEIGAWRDYAIPLLEAALAACLPPPDVADPEAGQKCAGDGCKRQPPELALRELIAKWRKSVGPTVMVPDTQYARDEAVLNCTFELEAALAACLPPDALTCQYCGRHPALSKTEWALIEKLRAAAQPVTAPAKVGNDRL